ncbi:MAG: autotransporter domain-containing protein, partial [Pseudomonadota bacterium]
NVTGSGGNGIEVATTNGGGATSITVDGDVVGSANGILLDSDSGGQTNTITIETGASVTGGSGAAILDAASGGSDETTVITSGLLDGDVILGSGDDVFEYMVGASVTGEIDGGGDIDAFILSGDSTGLAIDDSIDVSDFDFDNDGSAPSGSVGVTGFESFTKAGSSTFELTGTNDEAGLFDLMAGGLVFSGTFDDLSVAGAAGTSLGGGGTIGSFNTFGTVAPGAPDAIGTLSVTGDATFGAGSVFAVDVLDSVTGGDLLDVTGMVNISGGATVAVSLVGDAMNLPAAGSVTIISAGGGVIGDFASVTDDVPDIGFTAETLPNSVVLTLGADPDGDTSPQGGPAAALRGGLETTLVFANALRQGAANPGSNFLFERERLSFLPVGRDSAGEFSAIGGVFGAITDVRSSGTRDGYDVELAGLYLGTARSFGLASGTLTAGGAIAYSEADVETIGNDADVEAFQIGLFARYDGGALHASGALSYATLDFDFIRTPVAGVVATGDADGDGVGLSLEISYDVSKQLGATSDRMELRPFFGFDATYADRDGFTETGAGVLNMAVEGEDAFTGFARFGFELANTYEVGSGALRASATFGYERAFGQLDAATSSSLVGLGGTFSDPLADIDEDRILLGAKAAFGSGKVKGFVGYEGAIGNESEDHRGAIGFEMAF